MADWRARDAQLHNGWQVLSPARPPETIRPVAASSLVDIKSRAAPSNRASHFSSLRILRYAISKTMGLKAPWRHAGAGSRRALGEPLGIVELLQPKQIQMKIA